MIGQAEKATQARENRSFKNTLQFLRTAQQTVEQVSTRVTAAFRALQMLRRTVSTESDSDDSESEDDIDGRQSGESRHGTPQDAELRCIQVALKEVQSVVDRTKRSVLIGNHALAVLANNKNKVRDSAWHTIVESSHSATHLHLHDSGRNHCCKHRTVRRSHLEL